MTVIYNCSCSSGIGDTATLATLRQRMLIRMGYAAQLAAIPSGIVLLMNDYLQSAQKQLVTQFPEVFGNERFYTWPLVEGVRHYGIDENAEQTAVEPCTKVMDPNSIVWVGLKHDGRMRRLRHGIPPELLDDNYGTSWPTHYEVQQCIALWPAPNADAMELVVKATFGLGAFAADTDTTSLDAESVFLMAVANAKAHAGHPDAGNYMGMLVERIGGLNAGKHGLASYVPGEPDWVPPAPPVLVGGYIE